ncbi:MAG: LytR C-terminal domain-containing protein, partial [Solirubrobacterales bacterium]
LVGAAAAWYLTGQDGGSSGGGTGGGGGGKSAKSTKPSKVTVAVLNGTGGAEAGLAAEYSGFLEKKGFRLGATADAPETFDETIAYDEKGEDQQPDEGDEAGKGSNCLDNAGHGWISGVETPEPSEQGRGSSGPTTRAILETGPRARPAGWPSSQTGRQIRGFGPFPRQGR